MALPFLKKRRFPFTRPRHSGIRLQMVPMIDVVFLLLIYFLLTANFRTSEGFLPAQLPQQTQAAARSMVFDPLTLYLDSALDDSCLVQIDSPRGSVSVSLPADADFSTLRKQLETILAAQGRTTQDPIKLIPTGNTKWHHFVKTYGCLWQVGAKNVIFAVVP